MAAQYWLMSLMVFAVLLLREGRKKSDKPAGRLLSRLYRAACKALGKREDAQRGDDGGE